MTDSACICRVQHVEAILCSDFLALGVVFVGAAPAIFVSLGDIFVGGDHNRRRRPGFVLANSLAPRVMGDALGAAFVCAAHPIFVALVFMCIYFGVVFVGCATSWICLELS